MGQKKNKMWMITKDGSFTHCDNFYDTYKDNENFNLLKKFTKVAVYYFGCSISDSNEQNPRKTCN